MPDAISTPISSSTAPTADEHSSALLSERAMLEQFCRGDERYLWVQGEPWAGKSALLMPRARSSSGHRCSGLAAAYDSPSVVT